MQDFIQKFEKNYYEFLSKKEFQDNFAFAFNQFFHLQPKPYPGLKRTIIFQDYPLTLYHYQSITKKNTRKSYPLFIVYAFINRPTILDIQEDRSFIKKLLEHHTDVYLLDWGKPRSEDAQKPLKHYVYTLMKIIDHIPARKINLSGICQGGTLSLCVSALMPGKIHKLITIVTPVDFQKTLIAGLLKNIDTSTLTAQIGNIPGSLLSIALSSLKPFRLLQMKSQDQDFFLRMEKWIHDCPDHPGMAFHEFVHYFYQKNQLVKGHYHLDKMRIDLSQLRMPLLNIYAQQDHLVPPAASQALRDLTGSLEYTELPFSGGHIGTFVSQKALVYIPSTIADWLQQ